MFKQALIYMEPVIDRGNALYKFPCIVSKSLRHCLTLITWSLTLLLTHPCPRVAHTHLLLTGCRWTCAIRTDRIRGRLWVMRALPYCYPCFCLISPRSSAWLLLPEPWNGQSQRLSNIMLSRQLGYCGCWCCAGCVRLVLLCFWQRGHQPTSPVKGSVFWVLFFKLFRSHLRRSYLDNYMCCHTW